MLAGDEGLESQSSDRKARVLRVGQEGLKSLPCGIYGNLYSEIIWL